MAAYGKQPKPAGRDKKSRNAMPDSKLIALIEERESRARYANTFEDHAKSLSYYLGQPFGNEVDGQSKVVMREVYSTIEWIKPALLRMFFGGDQVVKFAPTGPEDVKQAEQETDVVEHTVVNRNDGFAVFYQWFTEALLARNAYVVAYWEDKTDVTESHYEGLTEDEMIMLVQSGEVEILEANENIDEMTGELTFDVKLRQAENNGKVCIETIPAERVLVEDAYKHVSLERARFVEYVEEKTISELRESGFEVEDAIADENNEPERYSDAVESVRYRHNTMARSDDRHEYKGDPASRVVRVRTIYMRVDYDGDGLSELRRLVVVGRTVLDNQPYDRICIAALTPTIMPHRHEGLSISDAVMDLQEIKSTLMRGMLDNMYLTNNGRHVVDEDRVNLDDLLTVRPGGIVRATGDPHSAVAPLIVPTMGPQIIQTIEYMDNVLENRTGASPRVLQGQSFDGNAINKTATGINTIMSAAMSRIELIARVFAETGVKELFQIVHTLLQKYGKKKEVLRLRNEWVPVDPREWQKRTNMTVEVGFGSGDKQARIGLLQMIISAQQGAMAMGLATPETVFNSLSKLTTEAGYKNPEEFWVNPTKPGPDGQPFQPPEPPQDPRIEVEAQKAAMQAQIEQAKLAAQAQAEQQRAALDQMKLRAEFEKTQITANLQKAIAFLNAQVDMTKALIQQSAARDNEELKLEHDDKTRTKEHRRKMAEKGVDEHGRPPKPRKKVAKHIRGADGRIATTEVVEVDDEDSED